MSTKQKPVPSTPQSMHQIDLGAHLSGAEMRKILADHTKDDVVRAILQLLRRESLVNDHVARGRLLNPALATPGGGVANASPAFAAGAAQGLEDVFWLLRKPEAIQ